MKVNMIFVADYYPKRSIFVTNTMTDYLCTEIKCRIQSEQTFASYFLSHAVTLSTVICHRYDILYDKYY